MILGCIIAVVGLILFALAYFFVYRPVLLPAPEEEGIKLAFTNKELTLSMDSISRNYSRLQDFQREMQRNGHYHVEEHKSIRQELEALDVLYKRLQVIYREKVYPG